jgi:hypothetical protein
MAFRFLRACTKIGLTACDDGRTFKSTSRLQALRGETPGSMRNKAMVLGTRGQSGGRRYPCAGCTLVDLLRGPAPYAFMGRHRAVGDFHDRVA